MKVTHLHFLLMLVVMALPLSLSAQVGINTTNPDSSAALHIKHNMKGVLLPVVDHANRQNMVSNGKDEVVSDGMLVYDDNDDVFYFWDKAHKRWLVVNPWQVTKEESAPWGDVRLDNDYAGRNVYIGAAEVPAAAKLHVEGTLRVESTAEIDGALTAKNGVAVTGNTNVAGTMTANTVVGYGTIPVGGIIMWSGASAPDGWALCDGTNGTPDLSGRFVVGIGKNITPDSRDTDTHAYAPGEKGGMNSYALTLNEMPKHTHDGEDTEVSESGGGTQIYDYPQGSGKTYGYRSWVKEGGYGLVQRSYGVARPDGSATFENTDAASMTPNITVEYSDGGGRGYEPNVRNPPVRMLFAGSSATHENRPPYYALAYIMRIR